MDGIDDRIEIVKEAYENNESMKEYIDAYAVGRHKDVEDCFGDAIVYEVFKMHFASK